MTDGEMLKSALYKHHIDLQAQMTSEARWHVPLAYTSSLDEIGAVGSVAGVMDVSHLGRIRVRGSGAIDLLERVCTCDVARQEDDTSAVTVLCNENGGIIDCCYLLRMDDDWLLTCDGWNRQKVISHLECTADDLSLSVKITDRTLKTTQLAITGPRAGVLLDAVLPEPVSSMQARGVKVASYLIAKVIVARTGYAGKWGVEVIVPNMLAGQAWNFLTRKKEADSIEPFGSAARDVMRIEAGFVKFGHEINEMIDPITASLGKTVVFNHDFIGADALEKINRQGPGRKLVKLQLIGDPATETAIPRHGMTILSTDAQEIGSVTSGAFSPSAGKAIALGYVSISQGKVGNEVLLEVDNGRIVAEIVKIC